jgi:molecular chaperone GrpE
MPDDKGPKIEVPEELIDEIDQQPAEPPSEASSAEETAEAGEVVAEASLEERLDDARDKYLRLAADFENYKRRARRERQELFNYANENLIKELLETVDNLERALEHAQQSTEASDGKTLLEGVELTYRSLMQALDKCGVQQVAPEGEEFDPNVHEAIRQAPSDEQPAGSVVEVLQKGYLLKDRLLRPALVVVSSGS